MDSPNDFGSSSSGSERKRPYRHSVQQTKRLEAYFLANQFPNERQRDQLGQEVGLTPTQIKFWFQNKRIQSKIQGSRQEGNSIRYENEMMKRKNLAMKEALKNVVCMSCKGLSPNEEEKQRIAKLKADNELLRAECAKVADILARSGVPVQAILSKHPSSG